MVKVKTWKTAFGKKNINLKRPMYLHSGWYVRDDLSAGNQCLTAISPSLLESEQLASLSQLLNLSDDVRHKNSLKGHATPVVDLQASCSLFDEDGEQLLWGIPLG